MHFDETITKKRSLGKLRKAPKTKPRSPDMTGTLLLQRHTAAAILQSFEDSDSDDVVCNIASWVNQDHEGPYLTVEISPKYVARELQQPSKENNLDFIFNSQENHS
jgi:hypothetical protein